MVSSYTYTCNGPKSQEAQYQEAQPSKCGCNKCQASQCGCNKCSGQKCGGYISKCNSRSCGSWTSSGCGDYISGGCGSWGMLPQIGSGCGKYRNY